MCLQVFVYIIMHAHTAPQVYIPELGRQFKVQPGTRLFACQNPLQQGFGRKGLPKSFVNRFTKVNMCVIICAFFSNELAIAYTRKTVHRTIY